MEHRSTQKFTSSFGCVVILPRTARILEQITIMPSNSGLTHRAYGCVQDHPLTMPDVSNSLTSSHTLPSSSTTPPGSSLTTDRSQITSSSLPSPGKDRRDPAPGATIAKLGDTFSERHLSEDISRYPSTITGQIGCATRDDRFADASGPYQMVPVNEYGVMIDLPEQFKMFAERSRDPTVSSFEAFVLAPSSSSFTIHEKNSTDKKEQSDKANLDVDGSVTEGKAKTPKSSPLKNQVKVSMESRRTINSAKASSDTIRSRATIIELSHSSTKTKQSWNLFSRIDSPNSARPKLSEESNRMDPPSSSKPSPGSAVTPKTQRQFRKISVQPVSPFQVPPFSQDTSSNKSLSRRSKTTQHGQTPPIDSRDISPPASDKTIRSFSALNRASIDTPAMMQRGHGWSVPLLRVDETPTKCKKVGANGQGKGKRDAIAASRQASHDMVGNPAHNSSGIKLVSVNPRVVSTTSISGIPRVETRYLSDSDLVTRLEANERDHPAVGNAQGEGEARAGYWDYSIVTGVEGSPSRDYAMLLRNASMLERFADLPSVTQKGKDHLVPTNLRPANEATGVGNATAAAPFGAPPSSSDKSLTCSSNYPDDTDDVSEQSASKYSGKRRGRHARRDRPVSMASLAAPLGENLGLTEQDEDVGEVEADCRDMGVALPMGPVVRLNTPCESSFGQVRLESPFAPVIFLTN